MTNLPGISTRKVEKLAAMGIESVRDMPDDVPLSERQRRACTCMQKGIPYYGPGLGDQLKTLRYPLCFMDLIREISSLPKQKAAKRTNGVLVEGETTGHAHRVEVLDAAEVLEISSGLYLRVGMEGVRIMHEEHNLITLPAGSGRLGRSERSGRSTSLRNLVCSGGVEMVGVRILVAGNDLFRGETATKTRC